MATGPNLRVRISADLADIKQGLGLLRSDLAKLKKQGEGAAPDTRRWTQGLTGLRREIALGITQFTALAGVVGSVLVTVNRFVKTADAYAMMNARLRLVTSSTEELSKAQRELFAQAQRSRSDLETTTDLYVKLAQSSESLRKNQGQLLAVTESVSQALVISGSDTAAAAAVTRQFAQALASGALRGDEFVSVMEGAPRLAKAIADGLGVPIGALRRLAEEGKLTSDVVIQALQSQASVLNVEFGQMPLTVSAATQKVENALKQLVGTFDESSGGTRSLAGAIDDLATALSDPQFQKSVAEAATLFVKVATAATDAVGAIREYFAENRNKSDASLQNRRNDLETQLFGIERSNRASLPIFRRDTSEIEGEIAEIDRIMSERARRSMFADVRSNVDTTETPGGGGVKLPTKDIAASNALLRDSISRALTELDRLYAGHEIGIEDYFAKRKELQERAVDAEIQQAQMELAVTKDLEQRRKLEEQIAKLQRDRGEIGAAAARDEKAATEELTKQLGEVKIQLLELDGDTVAAERARLEAEYQQLFKRLEANSDETGKAMTRNLIDRLVDQAALERLRSRAGEISGALQGREGSISAQVDAGLLGYGEGERQLQEVRATSLEQLRQLREETLAYLETMSPGSAEAQKAREFLAELDTDIATVTASQHKFRQQVEDQAASSLGGFFTDLVDGAKSFKDAFKDMVRSFVAGVAQMIAQELALRAVRAASSFFGGGATAGQLHGGGVAGAGGGVQRSVNPLWFGNAPRYHGGGIAGLAPNEVPAILERGERVRTEEQEAALQRQLASGSGGGSVVTTPIVVFGEQELAAAMAGHAGEQVVITHVRNNRRAIDD